MFKDFKLFRSVEINLFTNIHGKTNVFYATYCNLVILCWIILLLLLPITKSLVIWGNGVHFYEPTSPVNEARSFCYNLVLIFLFMNLIDLL